jgi:tetratricopeptide (TPR) repeat protein
LEEFMDLVALSQQATYILVPALSALCVAGKPIVDKGKEVLGDMIYEKAFEKLGKESAERATLLLKKINPKIGSSLEKALKKVSGNPEDSAAKEDLQQEILKLLKENQDLAREIELIVNINIKIDVVKQLVFGSNNLILNLEGIEGEELIKVMKYMEWKRQEELKHEILNSYSPSVLPDYSENLIKFVTENRAEELSLALKHLQKNKILLFSGIAGVGKTTLARILVDFRPTGVPEPFWFSFYHNRDAKLEDVLEALAAYLEAPEILSFKGKRQAGSTDINRLTEELRKRNSLWLVFDDLSYIIDEKRNFIDPGLGLLFKSLRDNNHKAKIILTSRFMPLLDNGEYLIDELEEENRQKIEGLKPDFAVSYLRENGFKNIELETLESLVESVDGHPFSLKLLVGLAKKHTAESILKDLTLYRKHQKDRIKNARFLFDKLVGGEKELLERISVYRQPEHLEAIKIMFTDSIPIDSVDALLDKSLLETDHKGKYWLHPLVQEFSYDDLENKKEVHLIAYDYYKSLKPPKNPTKKEDLQPALEAYHHACMAEEYDLAANIIWESNLYYLLDLWGNPRTLIEIYEKLLPKDHFKGELILKDKKIHGAVLGNLGLAYSHLGEQRKAIEYYEKALKIDREIGDRRGEGADLGNLGVSYSQLGETRKAIEYYEQALKIDREISDRYAEGNHLGNLGLEYNHLGETGKAIEYYEKALEISREIGDRRGEGNHLGNLGIAYKNLGEPRKAIEYYEQILIIHRELGDRRGEGADFGNLGNTYSDMGEPKKAIEYYEKALRISREVGDRRNEGNRLGNLGSAYSRLGEPRKAIEYYEKALRISREVGDRRGEGNALGNLGSAYSHLGEPKKAIEYYEQALKILREISDRRGEGNALGNLGSAYSYLRETRKAIEFLKQSLAIGKAIGDPRIISFCEQKLKELEEADD